LGVDAVYGRADETGLEEKPTGATHGIEEGRIRPSSGQIDDSAGFEWIHTPWLEERAIRRRAGAEVANTFSDQPSNRTNIGRKEDAKSAPRLASTTRPARERVSVVWSTGASTVSLSRISGRSRYLPPEWAAPMSFE
jgi:hypothetical protein